MREEYYLIVEFESDEGLLLDRGGDPGEGRRGGGVRRGHKG